MKTIVDMKSFKPDQWIIWVGAGISNPLPTSLPLGKKLTEFSLEKTCGEDESHQIFSIWERVKKLINQQKDYSDFGYIPRLESILDVINEVETKSSNTNFSFMKGFQSFLDAPSNALHHNLAILLSLGAKIITANFDLCIENAYENLQCGNDKLIPERFRTLTIYKSHKVGNVGEVWHYHGTADELPTLGATLKKIKDGLSDEVSLKLSELIAHSKILLFVGYSFSDAFDINPFFDNLPDKFFSDTKAIYYQHKSTNAKTLNTIAPPNIMRHLNCFKESQFDYGDTGDLLVDLSGNNKVFNGNFNWEDAFIKNANLNCRDKIRPFMVCRMANFLGINTNKISHNAYKDAMSFQACYPIDDFLDTMAVALRKQGKFGLEKKQHLKKKYICTGNLTEPDMLGYYYGIGDYKQASRYARPLDEISVEAASSNKVLNWQYYTSMAVYCRPIIQEYLVKVFRRKVELDDIQKINLLLPILHSLGNRALKNVESINQNSTALRFILLFKALLLGENDIETEKRILYLYGESSNIEGYISTFRDIAIKHTFLLRYHGYLEQPMEGIRYALISLRLSMEIGNTYGILRASLLLISLISSLLINVPTLFIRFCHSKNT